ncbi:hypothetical protein KBB96_06975 [Luteolibacter ambystomatis]|uniref:Uncharacterized protein n=1 Tax=Luteolibacter ambystomatis TaxID=2824561 RepID=A0A975PGJ4_9BACT|nr:hypothetical protein [Luteolibacter ambystomatis]QUE52630.1 hypothetical protein KBB96_06975 [Luteolibacter ambystomatis]
MKVLLGVIFALGAIIPISKIFSNSPREKSESASNREAQMQTLNGRSFVLAEEAGMTGVFIEITPQVDAQMRDAQRVKITFSAPGRSNPAEMRKEVYLLVKEFFKRSKQTPGFEDVSSYWFSPTAKLVDQYGHETQGAAGKLVIDREVMFKMNWDNATPQRIEQLFNTEATLSWKRSEQE